jgi:ribosomal protein L11 methyltransferase
VLELAAYGAAAERVLEAFPDASLAEVEPGWDDRWREFHHAVRIGPLWVGPPWETPPSDAIPVVIDPGRAFGTGAHPTTRLCLESLLDRSPGRLLDVGCGSGVIAIAAAKLGFAPVAAVDFDAAAVEATEANARANGVELDVRLADLRCGGLPDADLVAANITLAAVQALGPRLAAFAVLTSGYPASDRPELPGYGQVGRRELDGWAADLFERR